MSNLLKIRLYVNKCIFAECEYMEMQPYMSSFNKKFTFTNISFLNTIELINHDSIIVEILYSCAEKEITNAPIFLFEVIWEYSKTISVNIDDWWVVGKVVPVISTDENNLENYDYKQGFIDTLDLWQKGKEVDWESLSGNIIHKKHYIYTCLLYSGVSTEIVDRTTYEFNMEYIKEEEDFYYYAGENFFGKRGYIGWSLYSFEDCLLSILHEKGSFENKKVIFRIY